MNKGFLVIISAPSGAGKTTICKRLLKRKSELVYSISTTTRKPRGHEKTGVDYFFLTKPAFEKKIKKEKFAEWAIVHNNYYGTPKQFVDKNITSGRIVICDIDVQGGEKIIKVYPQAVKIFIVPPTWEELEHRLRFRATDSNDVIQRRLKNAEKELKYLKKYKYCVVNDSVSIAVKHIEGIINSEKLMISRLKNIDNFFKKG